MSNEFKLVPALADDEIQVAIEEAISLGYSAADIWSTAVASAPQPPALGGEPITRYDMDQTACAEPCADGVWVKFGDIAPLQAELASERALRREHSVRIHQLKDELKDVTAERYQLKARFAELKPLSGNIKECRSCGSTSLTWETHNKNTSGIAEGRLRSNEVRCVLVLGCDTCSETLAVVSADEFAARLNAALSKPAGSEKV